MIDQITAENWNISRFTEGDLIAFIALGAEPSSTAGDTKILYSVIVTNTDYEEISDALFDNIEEAVKSINLRFGHWSLSSLASKNEGGCSSCAAH